MLPASSFSKQELFKRVAIGVVVNNDDPERLQRIKARCRALHQGIPDEHLPWLRQGIAFSPQAHSAGGVASVGVPVIGSKVYVQFNYEDQYHGEYYPAPNTLDLKSEELVSANYPHSYGFIDRSGTLTLINTETDERLMVHPSGSLVHWDGAGRLKVSIADNKVGPNAKEVHDEGLTVDIVGNWNLKLSKDMSLNVTGQAEILTEGPFRLSSQQSINVDANNFISIDAQRIDENSFGPDAKAPSEVIIPKPRKRPTEIPFVNREDY